jgi:hypothetical protein
MVWKDARRLTYRSLGFGCFKISPTNKHTLGIINCPLDKHNVFTPINSHEKLVKCIQVRKCLANSWGIFDLVCNELQLDNTVCAPITYMDNHNMK